MSSADLNALEAALAVANVQAAATYQAAVATAQATVSAHVGAATIEAQAQTDVATIEAAWHVGANSATTQSASTMAAAQTTVAATEAAWHESVAATEANAQTTVAQTEANAQTTVATTEAQWHVSVANIEANAQTSVASTQAAAQESVAATEAAAQTTVAATNAAAQTTTAQIDGSFRVSVATIEAAAQESVASTSANAQTTVATTDANARTQVAQTEGTFQVQTANVDGGFRVQVASIESDATRYSADQQLAGVNVHETAETARLNIKLAFAQNIYTQISPLITQLVNAGSGFLGSLSGGTTSSGFRPTSGQHLPEPQSPLGFRGGASASLAVAGWAAGDAVGAYHSRPVASVGAVDLSPPQDAGQGAGGSTPATTGTVAAGLPFISARGVFTPAQLQQQINQLYARNDARTQGQIRKAQGDLAGRGFSSNSPILDALEVGYFVANLRASIEGASAVRLNAAQANVDAVFRGQSARSDQYLRQEQVLVDADQVDVQRQVGILNAVANLVGGIV
jgi:chemotaxis protein histidine kinase CheA